MTQDEIRAFFAADSRVQIQIAQSNDGSPEVAWGDSFISIAGKKMPFATLVTKDYPGFDEASRLGPGRFRLNLDLGVKPDGQAHDFTAENRPFPHPVYGAQGWVSIINPTRAVALALMQAALVRAVR